MAGRTAVLMARRAAVLVSGRATVLMAGRTAVLMAGRTAGSGVALGLGDADTAEGGCAHAGADDAQRDTTHRSRAQRTLVASIAAVCSLVPGHQQPLAVDIARASYGRAITKSRKVHRRLGQSRRRPEPNRWNGSVCL
jgi:hypothetical protein